MSQSLNLYNILQEVLNEQVDQNIVMDAIDNKYRAFIDYSDEKNRAPGQRLIEPYAFGITKAGNPALRAYQYQGATLRGVPKWKLFRLDRITKWRPLRNSKFELEPRDQGFNAPAYNEHGDNTMIKVIDQVKFDNGDNNGLYQPELDKLRKQTDQLVNHSNAIDLSKAETMPSGPIRQKKNNIYTSHPNSKTYAKYRQNVDNTQRNANDMNDYWADYDKAEQERMRQNGNNNNDDSSNYAGPIYNGDDDDNDDFDKH